MNSRVRAINAIVFSSVWMAGASLVLGADPLPNTFPERGWVVENGTLHKQAGERPGDIMTVDAYEDFEFFWEWKLMPMGNNGVKYFITEERGAPIGHEYQMIEDRRTHRPDRS